MLGFQPLTPHYDTPPQVDEEKYESAPSPAADAGSTVHKKLEVRGGEYGKATAPAADAGRPAVAHKRLAMYDGEYEKGLDKFAYRVSQVTTGLQTFVAALPNVNNFDSAVVSNVLGDVGRSFNFLNYTRRKYSDLQNTKPTLSEMAMDARTLRANANRLISDIYDPMGKYRADLAPTPASTARNYISNIPNATSGYGKQTEAIMTYTGMKVQEAYKAAMSNNGTKIYQRSANRHPLLNVSPTLVGQWLYEFNEKYKDDIKFKDTCPTVDYYQYISSAYTGKQKKSSPQEMLKFAVENLGFSSGYKDWQNFSPGSSHMWGMTIKPYVSPSGMAISRAPNLPVIQVPIWTTGGDGKLHCVFKEYDYGKMPPVVSYSFEVGSMRGSTIPIFDGSFNMLLGFEFENKLTLSFVDDEYHSMQKYMAMFINTIYRPSAGLMAPYDLCTWLVTLTAFRPGMGVNYSFQLICVPHSYTMSYQGTEQPAVETMQVTLSIVGMKRPTESGTIVAPGNGAQKSTWSLVNWNDVTVVPSSNTNLTDFDDDKHSWGEKKDFSKYNDAYSARQKTIAEQRKRQEEAKKTLKEKDEIAREEAEKQKAAKEDAVAAMAKSGGQAEDSGVIYVDTNPDVIDKMKKFNTKAQLDNFFGT
jgi:hypothetical protein